MHGAAKTHPVIVAVIRLQSITIISCLRIPIAIIIPTLSLKIKVILRLCGTVSRFYIGPMLLFYQTAQIKPTNYKCLFLCQLTCQSADIMSSLCGVGVRVRVNNFFSKTTRPRDMLFFLKDTLSIEDEKLFKACKSVCSSVC